MAGPGIQVPRFVLPLELGCYMGRMSHKVASAPYKQLGIRLRHRCTGYVTFKRIKPSRLQSKLQPALGSQSYPEPVWRPVPREQGNKGTRVTRSSASCRNYSNAKCQKNRSKSRTSVCSHIRDIRILDFGSILFYYIVDDATHFRRGGLLPSPVLPLTNRVPHFHSFVSHSTSLLVSFPCQSLAPVVQPRFAPLLLLHDVAYN